MTELPVIDLTTTRSAGHPDPATVAALDRACIDTGFFAVVGHGIGAQLWDDAFGSAARFFRLDAAAKEAVGMHLAGHRRGYLRNVDATGRTVSEMFDMVLEHPGSEDPGRPAPAAARRADGVLEGENQWPADGGFRATAVAYQHAALDTARSVLSGLAVALGLAPGYFDGHMRRPVCFLRYMHYPPVPGEPPSGAPVASGEHSDYGAITLLATDGVPGLEILDRHGGWHPVSVPPRALVVNLGDLLARWTNDRYTSTIHRVVSPGDRDRYSIPFFVNPDDDARVECLPTCVDDAHPCRYPATVAGPYLERRIRGVPAESA